LDEHTVRVGISHGLRRADGTYDLAVRGLDGLATEPGVELVYLDDRSETMRPDQLADLDAVVLEKVALRAASLEGVERLALVCRYGVGYDTVDIEACTQHGIIVTNCPDGTQRPMAVANLALILALSTRLLEKDRLARAGRWQEGVTLLGMGLMDRTLGLVGMGSIGGETLRLAAPLGLRRLVHDPNVSEAAIREAGAEPASLEDVFSQSDIVCLAVPLTPATRHIIGAREFALMKPTAWFINTSRGAVVDEPALIAALHERRIAGAGIDVFEQEPVDPDNPLLKMDHVIVAPHSLGSTDECFSLIGRSVTRSILDVRAGRVPRFVIDRRVLDHPRTQARLAPRASA
jgi:phosphoglycerate dehydrogenase-like enzyme